MKRPGDKKRMANTVSQTKSDAVKGAYKSDFQRRKAEAAALVQALSDYLVAGGYPKVPEKHIAALAAKMGLVVYSAGRYGGFATPEVKPDSETLALASALRTLPTAQRDALLKAIGGKSS